MTLQELTDLHDSITAPFKRLTEAYKQLEVAMCTPTLNIEPLPTLDIQLLPSRPRWQKCTRRRSRRLARRLAHRIGQQQMN